MFITVSSYNRSSGTDDNFQMVANQTIAGFTMIRLSKLVMSNTLYNVNENNKLTFSVSDDNNFLNEVILTVSVPPQNYSATSLAGALKTVMDSAIAGAGKTGTVQFTFGTTTTGKTTLTISNGAIQILPDNGEGLNLQLGFSRFNKSNNNDIIVSPRVYNLNKYSSLSLLCNLVKPQSFNSNTSEKIALLDTILLSGSSFGELYTYIPPNNAFTPLDQSYINNIAVWLRDDRNKSVDLNGGFISITCELI
jgi:hypothetical protein